jgi:hypothetical protein
MNKKQIEDVVRQAWLNPEIKNIPMNSKLVAAIAEEISNIEIPPKISDISTFSLITELHRRAQIGRLIE